MNKSPRHYRVAKAHQNEDFVQPNCSGSYELLVTPAHKAMNELTLRMFGCLVIFLLILWLTVDAPSENLRCKKNLLNNLNYGSTIIVANNSHWSFTSTQDFFSSLSLPIWRVPIAFWIVIYDPQMGLVMLSAFWYPQMNQPAVHPITGG
jgi:hypothetical protein